MFTYVLQTSSITAALTDTCTRPCVYMCSCALLYSWMLCILLGDKAKHRICLVRLILPRAMLGLTNDFIFIQLHATTTIGV